MLHGSTSYGACFPAQRACHGDHAYRELERPSVLEGDDAMGAPRHSLTSLGQVVDASCGCQKSTCCALGVVDRREAAGYRYVPDPIDTSSVHMDLNPQVCAVCDLVRLLVAGSALWQQGKYICICCRL